MDEKIRKEKAEKEKKEEKELNILLFHETKPHNISLQLQRKKPS